MGFQIVYVDNALDQVGNNETWDLLQQSLRLRMLGYRKEYSKYVLPLSRDDFFSTQILIFDGSKLVCTYKFTRYDLCQQYRVPFPVIQVLEDSGTKEFTPLLSSIVKNAETRKHRIAYCGGWAIHPEARENKTYSRAIREMVAITHHHYMESFSINESLILGVVKFKAHLFQEYVGYKRIEKNGQILGEVELSYLDNEPVCVLHLTQTSEEVKAMCKEKKAILDSAKFYTMDQSLLKFPLKKAA